MRVLILIASIVMSILPIMGQTYFKDGTEWKTLRTSTTTPDDPRYYQEFSILSDASIKDGNGFNLYEKSGDEAGVQICQIKVNDNRVYFYDEKSDNWLLMYDFNVKKGDCISVYTPVFDWNNEEIQCTYLKCIGEENYEDNGTQWPALRFEEYEDSKNEKYIGEGIWLKGLGSVTGLLENCRFYEFCGMGSKLYEVVCDNEVIYKSGISSVSEVEKRVPTIKKFGRSLMIGGIKTGTFVSIHSIDGKTVRHSYVNSDNYIHSFENPGVYIIKMDDKIVKVLVN